MASVKNYTLKAFKKFKTRDGLDAYQGTIYLDNERVGFYTEDGNGGYPYIDYKDNECRTAAEKAAQEYAVEHKIVGDAVENFYGAIVELIISERDYKKHLAKDYHYMIVFVKKGEWAPRIAAARKLHVIEQIMDDADTEKVIGFYTDLNDFDIK